MSAEGLRRDGEPAAHPREPGRALLVLLEDEHAARELGRTLEALRDPTWAVAVDILVPPIRGLDFFADEARQHAVDAWWSRHVSRSATPVFLLMDVAGLEEWVGEVDGDVYVGLTDARRLSAYAAPRLPARGRVHLLRCETPLQLAAAVMDALGPAGRPEASVYAGGAALRGTLHSPRLAPPAPFEDVFDGSWPGAGLSSRAFRSLLRPPDTAVAPMGIPSPPSGGPQESTLSDGRALALKLPSAPAPELTPLRLPGRRAGRRVRQLLGGRAHHPRPDVEVARQLAARGPTIVVTGSRKGGVGKTSFAAGIAVTAGGILGQVGHRACIVDANIANPDAWGDLHLPPGAATVRGVTAALLSNREPPPPVHAATPGLACYPEVREPTDYSLTAIRVFSDYLRRRYTFIVVDMSNRLPDPTGGPEAAVAAYWLEAADVLVLPTTSARADFNGALDYLDIAELPPTLVPYIVPDDRRLRENPATLEYLRAIRRHAHAVVGVPDEANLVRLAGMEGVPVEQVSARLRLAYRLLTEAIVDMPRRGR